MLNRSASLAMSTSFLKALPGKLDIKRHSPSILYIYSRKFVLELGDNCIQNFHLGGTVYSRYLEFQGTGQNMSSNQ